MLGATPKSPEYCHLRRIGVLAATTSETAVDNTIAVAFTEAARIYVAPLSTEIKSPATTLAFAVAVPLILITVSPTDTALARILSVTVKLAEKACVEGQTEIRKLLPNAPAQRAAQGP